MCGRFANRETAEKLVAQYQAQKSNAQFEGSYNICPTESAPIVREQDQVRDVSLARFGTPMKIHGRAFPLINIQSEKARNRRDFAERRCIIPATGFFEWEKITPKDKQPYFFSAKDGMLSFAGVWSLIGNELAFSIFTTTANEVVGPVHARMPVILGHNAQSTWLAGDAAPDTLMDLMQPYSAGLMQSWKVSKDVNSVKNKGEFCINSL